MPERTDCYSCDNGSEQSLFKHSGPYFKPRAFLVNLQLGRLSVIDFRASISKLGFIVFSVLCPNHIYINCAIIVYRATNDLIVAIIYFLINDIFRRVCELNLNIVFVYSCINTTFTDSVNDVNSIVCHHIDIIFFNTYIYVIFSILFHPNDSDFFYFTYIFKQ
ncbi:hypothetical protein K4K55_003382 [Colletotrichum sp. SAR 10_96]|nr:hypothetical protein K4K55_003382 [Colletotrichum sp. SAR 10_96]